MKVKMLHLLCWHLNDITYHLNKIKSQGFTHIMISPIQPLKTEENQWYWLYQPIGFSIGNRLGTRDEYINLCDKAHNVGLKVIVDVVLRHFGGKDDGSLYPHEKCDNYITSKREFWLDPIPGNEENRWQIINRNFGMPSINYYNSEIQEIYRAFLADVMSYSDGIRIDMGKHFALPYEGGCGFWPMIKQLCESMGKECYAECINLDKKTMKDYTAYTKVLVADYEATDNRNDSLVFFESHDTYYTWGYTKGFTDKERIHKYSELVKNFNNVLLFARPFDKIIFGDEVRNINNLVFYK